MLALRDISFAIEGRPLIDPSSVIIPAGHKVGLVGRNGSGKTTLFKLIQGDLDADTGSIAIPRGTRIGGVAQEAPASETSLRDTVLQADTELMALRAEANVATDPARISEIQLRLSDIGAHSAEARAAAILTGLGFSNEEQGRPTKAFSGGWRMRVALAAILFSQPDFLLLDEPTNYLDLEGTIWLENYLARYPHTVLIISHDRELLNRAVGHILHLSQRTLTLYTGNYDTFEADRRAKLELLAAQAKKQEAERAHLQSFVDRFRYKASKARQAQSRVKRLEKMEPVANLIEGNVAGFSFEAEGELSPPIVRLDEVDAGYDGVPVLRGLDLRIDPDDRIALLGANGQGKSTLSKIIAGRLDPLEGGIRASSRLKIGYFAQHQLDELTLGETPLDHLRRLRPALAPAQLRSILASGGLGAEIVENPVERLSGGQKARLALLIAALDKPHLLILDEPTNHLDIESREALIQALTIYEGAVILVSHDAHLVDCVADRLWLVDQGRVKPFDEDMAAYRSFLLARRGVKLRDPAKKAERVQKAEKKKANKAVLRAEVEKCEARMEKLDVMRRAIDEKLSDPNLYMQEGARKMNELQKKRHEIEQATARAEDLWIAAQERLDAAG